MLEIYNEQVRDLLNPSSNKKGGLKVRESPKIGFYGKPVELKAILHWLVILYKSHVGVSYGLNVSQ